MAIEIEFDYQIATGFSPWVFNGCEKALAKIFIVIARNKLVADLAPAISIWKKIFVGDNTNKGGKS